MVCSLSFIRLCFEDLQSRQVLMRGIEQGYLYRLVGTQSQLKWLSKISDASVNKSSVAAFPIPNAHSVVCNTVMKVLWHRRLGHLSFDVLCKVMKHCNTSVHICSYI